MKCIIRPASLPQASALAALHNESFLTEGWSLDQVRGSLALTTTKAWAAYNDETPIGFVVCQNVPEETEILTLCVRPEMRRHGIATRLLQHMADEMRGGDKTILLEVAADNDAARQLYERFGFAVYGTRPNYYKRGAVTVDAVMYRVNVDK